MKTQATTPAAATRDAQTVQAVTTRQTSAAQSKYSARVFIFAVLSTVLCMLALANIASAASPAAEDQYVEKTPSGTGTTQGSDDFATYDTNGDGVVSDAEVKQAAKKNKKKKNKKDDDGATGSSGAAGGGSGTPPSSSSPADTAAAATKIGPFSKTTAAILAVMALGLGGLGLISQMRKPPVPGGP